MTAGGTPDLNYLLEGPEDAPVLVLSNSLGTALEMWDQKVRDLDLRDRLSSIGAPTLVVSGAEDPATPPEHRRLISDAIPGALRGRS